MEKKNTLTKILAIVGAALAWLPLLAPVLLGVISLMADGIFRFDYLMPAELFPVVLVGGVLLLWAAVRARAHWKIIAWGLGIAALFLFGGQALSVVTGLASGAAAPAGWRLALVLASLIIYLLAVIAIGVGGILLLRGLFGVPRRPEAGHSAAV